MEALDESMTGGSDSDDAVLIAGFRQGSSLSGLGWRASEESRRCSMSLDNIVGLILSVGLLVYLAYALLKPEKF